MLTAALFSLACFTLSAQHDTMTHAKKHAQHAAKMYCCSQHPNQVSSYTGKCPACGKELALRKRENENGSDEIVQLPHASGREK